MKPDIGKLYLSHFKFRQCRGRDPGAEFSFTMGIKCHIGTNEHFVIPIALQISALAYGGGGVFGKGFGSMDAVIKPTWTYSRRPLTGTPTPKFD